MSSSRSRGRHPLRWPKTSISPTPAAQGANRAVDARTSYAEIIGMRVTLNLPDDVYVAARSLADLKGISLGEAVGELARRGLHPEVRIDAGKAFPCFAEAEGAGPITIERTLAAEDEM